MASAAPAVAGAQPARSPELPGGDLEHEIQQLEQFTQIPQIVKATCRPADEGGVHITVRCPGKPSPPGS